MTVEQREQLLEAVKEELWSLILRGGGDGDTINDAAETVVDIVKELLK